MARGKNAIIGTAGHIDHGKTSLVKALTGIDTDRLAEEKKRGITIETGYAHLELPDGGRAGVVDVPGHERFIKNMLASSGGIDLTMLVVAADDGVMPQTREHLSILQLLGINDGLVVISKCDLVDDEWLLMVRQEISETVAGTFLEGKPVAEISARTGQGIEELRSLLISLIQARPNRETGRQFRLPVDRVFTLPGFGTVGAGTLVEGGLTSGDEIMVYPQGLPVKIRGLQVHSQPVEKAWPGQRVAVNLAGLKKEDLSRGNVLAASGSLTPTMMLDARLDILADSPFKVKNNSLVHLYLGAKELLAKVVLLDEDELERGGSGYAQLRLVEPVAVKKNDRFVIRFYSPMITIGGGLVLDAAPLKRRRNKADILKHFETKESGSHLERVELALMERPETYQTLDEIILRAGLDKTRARNDCENLVKNDRAIALTRDIYVHQRDIDWLKNRFTALLSAWHRDNPCRPGLPLSEAKNRLMQGARSAVFEALIKHFEEQNFLMRELADVRLAGFIPEINEAENELISRLEDTYLEFALNPAATSAVSPAQNQAETRLRKAAFAALVRRGVLVRLDDLYHLHRTHYDLALKIFRELAQSGNPVLLAQYRDALGSSRKVAVALLEKFDQAGITEKDGEGRRLKNTTRQ